MVSFPESTSAPSADASSPSSLPRATSKPQGKPKEKPGKPQPSDRPVRNPAGTRPEETLPTENLSAGKLIDGRYRLLGVLGQGNSGTTHRAQRLKDGVIVALKEVSLQGAQSWKLIELFEREVAMLKQLNHPAIPRYIDSFVVDSPQDRRYYLAQTLAEGKTLTAWIEGGWRCTEAEAQGIALQLLDILGYLQRCNPPVIHRDIKPLNIIRQPDGKIFLVDFGAVGHTYHNTFMRGSTVVGTFGYMAPEQFRGQACTATDLYSLGATLLYLLTRRSPAELPAKQLKVDFRSKVLLSDGFADWLGQLIEPSLRHRFSSASVALTTLKRLQQEASRDQGLLKPALKILAGLSVLGLVTLFVINQYKYSVLKHLGTEQEIKAAIAAGDIPVAEYLKRGGDRSLDRDQGQALLIFAVEQNDLASLEQLLNQGVNPALANREGTTALHEAARHPDLAALELMLKQQPDVNLQNRQGNTPLHLAATAQHALLLMEQDVDLSVVNHHGQSSLQNAVEQSWHPVISSYLNRTQAIPQAVPTTPSLLGLAAKNKDVKTVKLLVRKGARFTGADLLALDFDIADLSLYQEAQRNWFVTGMPRINSRDSEGKTLLYDAIRQERWELGSLLISLDAAIDDIDLNNGSAGKMFERTLGMRYTEKSHWTPQEKDFYRRLFERDKALSLQHSYQIRKQHIAERKRQEQEAKRQGQKRKQ